MSILIQPNTAFLVQGMTGREGSYYTAKMLAYGTNIVGGVSPEKGGEWLHGKPIFDNIRTATEATGANASIVFVNAASAVDAIFEAVDAELELIVCVTDGIPIQDTLRLRAYLDRHLGTRLIGPSSPGIVIPRIANVGIVPTHLGVPGRIGIVSRSASLAYEVMTAMVDYELGVSTFVGIGGDPVVGTSFAEILMLFEEDLETSAVVLIGEIGGSSEIEVASYIGSKVTKQVVAYVAGQSAAPYVRMGHAGAVFTTPDTSAAAKIEALQSAGARVARSIEEVVPLLAAR